MAKLQHLLSPCDDDKLQYDPAERFHQQQMRQQRWTLENSLPSISALTQSRMPFELNTKAEQQQHAGAYLPLSSTHAQSPPGQQEHVLYEYRQELYSDQNSSRASAARDDIDLASTSLQPSQSTQQQRPPCLCGCDPVSLEDEANMLMSTTRDVNQQPGVSAATFAAVGKQSRYLREMDRLAILQRLDRGEKQSVLAKEYHVSRSSICTLLKHRDEVLARVNDQNPFCKHPKKMKPTRGTTVDKAAEELITSIGARYVPFTPVARNSSVESLYGAGGVYCVNSRATPVLLSTLDKPDLAAPEFRKCATQLMVQLVQEALVVVPALTNATTAVSSLHRPLPLCAITMEQNNQHTLLDVFYSVEPHCPRGYVQFERSQWHSDVKIRLLDYLHPQHFSPTLVNHNVLLLDAAVTSPSAVALVLESVQLSGNVNITLVAVFVTRAVVEMVQTRFPAVRIVAAEIESRLTLQLPPQAQQLGHQRDERTAAAGQEQPLRMPRSLLFKRRLELWYQSQELCFTLAV